MESTKGINAYKLKWIAIITMLIDHCYKVFGIVLVPVLANTLNVGEAASDLLLLSVCGIGSITMPIFAFFIAEGCKYTHDKARYIGRLVLFAMIAEVPFQILVNAINVEPISLKLGMTNILFTFALGALACCAYQFFSDKNQYIIKWVAPILCAAIAYLLGTDYGAYGVLFTFIAYVVKNKKAKVISLIGLIALFRGIIYPLEQFFSYGFYISLLIGNAIILVYSLLSIVLLAAYNGQRGKKSKYFFYIFYPLHMVIVGLIPYLFFS